MSCARKVWAAAGSTARRRVASAPAMADDVILGSALMMLASRCLGGSLSLRLDVGDAHVFAPGRFFLDEQRLRGLRRGDERVAAERIEELARLVGGQDLVEP